MAALPCGLAQAQVVEEESVVTEEGVVDEAAETVPFNRGTSPDNPETLLIKRTLAPELQAAVDELPDQFREAVWLRDVEEFSYSEIADMLNIPVGTVMSRISRGRRMLFNRLSHPSSVNA